MNMNINSFNMNNYTDLGSIPMLDDRTKQMLKYDYNDKNKSKYEWNKLINLSNKAKSNYNILINEGYYTFSGQKEDSLKVLNSNLLMYGGILLLNIIIIITIFKNSIK